MNNLELYILKASLNYEAFTKYRKYLDEFFSEPKFSLRKIYQSICKIFDETGNKETIGSEELSLRFFTDFPFQKKKDAEYFSAVLERLSKIDGPSENMDSLLRKLKEKGMVTEIARAAINMAEGSSDPEKFISTLDEYLAYKKGDKSTEVSNTEFVSEELGVLFQNTVYSGGLNWRLQCLRESLGPLRKGDFGFLFARPETGKTTFLASEISNFLTQVQSPILWFNNEEQGGKVFSRVYQAVFGVKTHELMANPDHYYSLWKDMGLSGKLLLYDNAAIHRNDVSRLVEQHKPSCVVFDQIDKLKGFNDDRNDLELGQIYIWARELAKQYCPVIGVCQAGGTAGNKMWLTMEDVVNAKTAKQAEADWILGIGVKDDSGNSRFLNISKNKLQGGPETLEETRHGKFQVIIRPEIARYEDI